MRRLLAVIVAGLLSSSCSSDGLAFYEVVRSRVTECLIRANGEFCVEPDQFDPPSVEVWTVETRADRTILYANEEVWILDALPEDADPATTRKFPSPPCRAGCSRPRWLESRRPSPKARCSRPGR